ncbi:MAG: tetratricopeptide repeat protein [Nitrospirales bacterium]|nr:tetratricopeptide repeat protein [Nitrospirales bacterium]
MAYKIKDAATKSSPIEAEDILSSKERFFFWVEENRTLVWGGILLFLVVVIAVVALNWLSKEKREQAWELQGKAQSVYLDRPFDDVKKGKENIQKASSMFQEVREKFPGTKGAEVSLFLLGNSLMEAENYQEAIEKYQEFLKTNAQDPVLTGLVQQRLGLAYLLSGNREGALSTWQGVLDDPLTLNKDQILFELAKLAESENKTPEAVGHYKKLMQEYPLSPFSNEAALRIKVLAPEESAEGSKTEPSSPEAKGGLPSDSGGVTEEKEKKKEEGGKE